MGLCLQYVGTVESRLSRCPGGCAREAVFLLHMYTIIKIILLSNEQDLFCLRASTSCPT